MLGPVRFTHIEDCTREVCQAFRTKDELEDCIATLGTLDDMLALLRSELAELNGTKQNTNSEAKKKQDYKALLDLSKAKRLVTARENSIKSVQASLLKAKEKMDEKPTADDGSSRA